jgi:hypothetical protein
MLRYERYRASGGTDAGPAPESPAAVTPFAIEVRFLGGLSTNQKNAFKNAAKRWTKVIVGDLPTVNVEGELIDDIVILAQGTDIDGPDGILGQAGPTHLRPANAPVAALLPARGIMSFDTADLAEMETKATLNDVITHEMGHVLGIGTIWKLKNLVSGSGTTNPTFKGTAARKAYGDLKGSAPQNVPIENTGGPGTREGHWRETIFKTELMSGFISASGNPLSRVTVASLQDLGYVIDVAAAEPYTLPNLLALAEEGALVSRPVGTSVEMVLPSIPVVLADEAMTAVPR